MADEDLADDSPDLAGDGSGSGSRSPEVVHLPITRELDFHTFRPRDFTALVADYLEAASALGFARVRIIHGRGIGFQRQEVQKVLAVHPLVASFADDLDSRLGATWVDLRRF